MIAAPSIRDQPLAAAHPAAIRSAVHHDVCLDHGAHTANRQDDAAASNYLSPVTIPVSPRAVLAAADGSNWVAAALAFFLSCPSSRLAKPRTGRLRL